MKWLLPASLALNLGCLCLYAYHHIKIVHRAPPGSIVMLGDSMTEYGDWSKLLDTPVVNRGRTHDTTAGMLGRLNTAIEPCPSRLFILGGYNDLYTANLPPETVSENISQIVHQTRNACPFAIVYVQSILPVASTRPIDIPAVNRVLASLADGRSVIYVDLYRHFEQDGHLNPDLSDDGIHPNYLGFQLWRDVIAQNIKSKPRPTDCVSPCIDKSKLRPDLAVK